MVGRYRIACCVPFCSRGCYAEHAGTDWICWGHWKRIPLARRRAYFRAVAERAPHWLQERQRAPRWMLPRPVRQHDRPRSIDALFRLFDRLKREAIARAL